jgi:hypothetical protein
VTEPAHFTPVRRGRRSLAALAAALITSVIALGGGSASARADDGDPIASDEPSLEQELAERFAPIIMIKAQTAPCDSDGEAFRPSSVEIVLDNSEILLRQVGRSDPVMTTAPTSSDLFRLGEGFYLDFPGESLDPSCVYEHDFDKFDAGLPPTVYAHVARQDDQPDQLALQYWFYWYFNDWNNKHESDWEGIQLLFDVGTVEEALRTDPVSVGYAQHEGGERADWDASKLERDGAHPVVYSSAGSHASYYSSALYIGRSASEGFGCDDTDGPSARLDPETVVLPDRVDDPDDPLAWLSFEGRWGERREGSFNGPTGPASKDRWAQPIEWHDDLRADSAIVPAGDSQADAVISAFCGVVEWGSTQLIVLTTSPARFLTSLLVTVLLAVWLIRRTEWSATARTPLVQRRRAGQIVRSAASTYRHRPLTLIGVGLIYLPVTWAVNALAALVSRPAPTRRFVELIDDVAQTRMLTAHLLGALAGMVAYLAVSATLAAIIRGPDGATPPTVAEGARRAWGHRRAIASGFVRSLGIVVGLAITLVGIPWAIRQLVRYQFLPQVAVLEGGDGRSALARSSELVRGRWWYVAGMLAMFNLLIGAVVFVLGLLVLIVMSGLPFWVYTGVVALIQAFVVPLAAVAQTFLYGDSVAAHDERISDGASPQAVESAAASATT